MDETFPRGRFVWHELATTDPDAAAAFYKKVVGWSLLPYAGMPEYRMWVAGGTPLGGLMKMPAPSRWLPYIAVPDVDASARQAVTLGARTIVPPQDIPSVGRFSILADPHGAGFALYRSAGAEIGHDGPAKLGEFSWHELITTDAVAAWEFYHTLFGWVKAEAMDMGPDGVYQMFSRAGSMIGGMYNLKPGTGARPHWLSYANVPSADKAAALVTKLGGKILFGPMDVAGGDRIVSFTDAQGVAFAVHATKAAAAVATAKPAKKPAKKPATTAAAKKSSARKPAAKKKASKKSATKKKTAAPARAKRKPAPGKKPAKKARRAPARKRVAKKKGRRR